MSTLLDLVNVGTTPGDGTGDTLRNSMLKVNNAIDRANVLTHQMNTISFIGDSITNQGYEYKYDSHGLIFLGSNAPALDEGTGSFEYDSATSMVRWTAPSDTPGQWVPLANGIHVLYSGTENKWGTFYTPKEAIEEAYPNGTQADVEIVLNETFGYTDRGFQNWLQILSGQRLTMINLLGAIGSTTADGLSRINQCYEIDVNGMPLPEGWGPKVVVIYFGVNDLNTPNQAVEDSLENMRLMVEYVIKRGSLPVICTIPHIDPWAQDFNKGLKQIAFQYHTVILADFMNATRDPLQTDGTMLGGETNLHFNNQLAFLAGRELFIRLQPFLNGFGRPTSEFAGDIYNLCRNGALLGNTGQTSTNVSGQIADDYTIVTTGDVVVVAYKENSDYFLPWQVFDCSTASDGDTVVLKLTTTAHNTYATVESMGLVACDKVYADIEFEGSNVVNLLSFTLNIRFYNGVSSQWVSSNLCSGGVENSIVLPPEHTDGILRTPTICVPDDTTHVSAEVHVLFKAGGEGLFKVRSMGIAKVEQ